MRNLGIVNPTVGDINVDGVISDIGAIWRYIELVSEIGADSNSQA
jgi:hypothetical protein